MLKIGPSTFFERWRWNKKISVTPWGRCNPLSIVTPIHCQLQHSPERYGINAIMSVDEVLNEDRELKNNRPVMPCSNEIWRSLSEVHPGVDQNEAAGWDDIDTKSQTVWRTMYEMMEAEDYDCSGIGPQLAAHLWKTFALSRMTYSLEVFQLSEKDIAQVEQLQRPIFRRILKLTVNTLLTTVYGLLGIYVP